MSAIVALIILKRTDVLKFKAEGFKEDILTGGIIQNSVMEYLWVHFSEPFTIEVRIIYGLEFCCTHLMISIPFC